MLAYAVKRTGLAVVITAVALIILISMIQLIPGDPAAVLLGPLATPEMREQFRIAMGLDQPVVIQIARFFGRVVTGDLGTDVLTNRSGAGHRDGADALHAGADRRRHRLVGAARHPARLLRRRPPRLARRPDRRRALRQHDRRAVLRRRDLQPAVLLGDARLVPDHRRRRSAATSLDQLHHLVLPSLAVGLGWVGYLARMVRASMLEVLTREPHPHGARLRPARAHHHLPLRAEARHHPDRRRCSASASAT